MSGDPSELKKQISLNEFLEYLIVLRVLRCLIKMAKLFQTNSHFADGPLVPFLYVPSC
jgi:hypothetical protein